MKGQWATLVLSVFFLGVIGFQNSFPLDQAFGGPPVTGSTGEVSWGGDFYPIPFGDFGNFATSSSNTPDGRSLWPIHQTAMDAVAGLQVGETLGQGIVQAQILILDPDFNISQILESSCSLLHHRSSFKDSSSGHLIPQIYN